MRNPHSPFRDNLLCGCYLLDGRPVAICPEGLALRHRFAYYTMPRRPTDVLEATDAVIIAEQWRREIAATKMEFGLRAVVYFQHFGIDTVAKVRDLLG